MGRGGGRTLIGHLGYILANEMDWFSMVSPSIRGGETVNL